MRPRYCWLKEGVLPNERCDSDHLSLLCLAAMGKHFSDDELDHMQPKRREDMRPYTVHHVARSMLFVCVKVAVGFGPTRCHIASGDVTSHRHIVLSHACSRIASSHRIVTCLRWHVASVTLQPHAGTVACIHGFTQKHVTLVRLVYGGSA